MDATKLEWIRSKSLVNCHVVGLDSILFDNTSGARIRAFFANENHELWKNALPIEQDLSVALHPHHCAITLVPVFGHAYNVVEQISGIEYDLPEFLFQSQINTGKGKFTATGMRRRFRLGMELLTRAKDMNASEIHTVYVPKGESAAWYVYEHLDDPTYRPLAWSNVALDEKFSFDGLYQPMKMDHLMHLLDLMNHPLCRISTEAIHVDIQGL